MSDTQVVDTISILFQAKWCGPCKKIKPYYETQIKQIYTLNGISMFEYDYDDESTQELMDKLGVKGIPKLCVINCSKVVEDPFELTDDIIVSKVIMDSKQIETDAMSCVSVFSTNSDF